MIVFVEYVLLDNLIIDFILFYSVCKILKTEIKKWRIIFASILGTAFAFLTPIINMHNTLIFITKLLIGIILVYIAIPTKKCKLFFVAYITFIFLTFILGGICYGLKMFFCTPKIINGNITYTNDFPISLIIFAIFIFIILGNNVYSQLKLRKKFVSIIIYYHNKKMQLKALIDSGNQLIDKKTKLPISFLSKNDFDNYFGKENFQENKTYQNLICSTVSGTKLIETILVDNLKIVDTNTSINNARIALYDFNQNCNFGAIISENLIN